MNQKQERAIETIERVLESALSIFKLNSDTQINIAILSETSGVSIGSIYHHFKNSEGVSAKLYLRCLNELLNYIYQSIHKKTDFQGLVYQLVKSYLLWTKKNPVKAAFIHASSFSHFIKEYSSEIELEKSVSLQKLQELLLPHIQNGTIKKIPFYLYEIIIIGPVAEFSRRWLNSPKQYPIHESIQYLSECILKSLA